jgi:hypothetical protein
VREPLSTPCHQQLQRLLLSWTAQHLLLCPLAGWLAGGQLLLLLPSCMLLLLRGHDAGCRCLGSISPAQVSCWGRNHPALLRLRRIAALVLCSESRALCTGLPHHACPLLQRRSSGPDNLSSCLAHAAHPATA